MRASAKGSTSDAPELDDHRLATIENDAAVDMPELEPIDVELVGPLGARSTVYRQGDHHFEIDTPSKRRSRSGFVFCVLSAAVPIIALSVWLVLAILQVIDGKLGWLVGVAFCGPLLIAGSLVLLHWAINLHTHQNLVITDSDFHIKRTIEYEPVAKDSINHPEKAAERLTWTERWFCKQLSGKRGEIMEAEIVEKENAETVSCSLCLNTARAKHVLEMQFGKEEREWLAERINSFLQNSH